MSVSVWQQAVQPVTAYECDVAVIGAGIIGAYTAHTLATHGKRVALLEARFPAAGATGRNAGMCTMGGAIAYTEAISRFGRDKARELWLLTRENQVKTLNFIEKFGLTADRCGKVTLAINETIKESLAQSGELLREDGFDVRFSPTDPYKRGFSGALFNDYDFGLHPPLLVQGLLADAPQDNLRLFAPAEVFAIHEISGGKLQVEAKGVTVRCDQIALCTNAYSPLISPYFNDKVAPRRGQILLTAPLKRRVLDRLASANYGYEYFRQLEDGSFLLGGGREHNSELEAGYDETATAWVQSTLEEFMQKYYPDVLAEVPIVRRWAGTMGFAVDSIPLVGRLPEVPGQFQPILQPFVPAPPFEVNLTGATSGATNIFFAVGFTGHGMGWGMRIADFMLEQMLGTRTDAGLFDVKRLSIHG